VDTSPVGSPQSSRSVMVSPPETRDETFKKQDRILSRQIFRRVYEQGHKFRAEYFTAFVLPNSEKRARVGITATRKTGNSVARNRSRRLVREVFRKNKWRVPPAIDIVINVKSSMAEARYDDIEKDFVHFLERNNFLVGKDG
jgi:ribonuclease P protein component